MSTSEKLSTLKDKTLKREVAAVSLAAWFYLTHHLFWNVDALVLPAYLPFFTTVTGVVWTFAGASFGADAIIKYLQSR